jgi:2-dehydro-3-deoxyphosphogluconate aldolase/(4S)-4-hydroxy-2-oxoglutarate aldolase
VTTAPGTSLGAVVPILVIDDAGAASTIGRILVDAGISSVEVTLRTDAALDAIENLESLGELRVGAGTVLTAAQLTAATERGASFIVSPGLDADIIALAQDAALAIFPGVATPTEVQAALRLGLDHLKLFPAGALGATEYLTDLSGPFPDARFMPSGGVNPDNAARYLAHPSVFAVSTSWMAPRALIARAEFDEIARRCQLFLSASRGPA